MPLRFHPAWVVVIGACAAFFHQAMASGLSTDVFWQLASGQWMLAHHALMRHDVFSYTITGHPWFAEEWGFEVILAWSVSHLGAVAFWLVAALPCSAALLFGVIRWRRMGAQPLWAAALAVVVATGLLLGLDVRPQVFSYALFAAELLVLTLARRDTRWLLALPPMMLFWANVHGSFLAGLGVIALEVVLASATVQSIVEKMGTGVAVTRPLPARKLLATLVASVAAACVNPHGPALFGYVVKVATSSRLSASIVEWQSPNFNDPLELIAIAVPIAAGVAILASSRRRVELFDLLVWLVLLVATLRAVRFAPYLSVATGGVLAPYQPIRRETIRPTLASPVLAALVCIGLLGGAHPPAGAPAAKGSSAQPVAAAAWLAKQHGRVFSTYVWNDYLIHVGIPVFVDGRTDLYFGTGVYSEYLKLNALSINPDPVLSRYHVEWVLWPRNSPMSVFLASDPTWRVARRMGPAIVFQRVAATGREASAP